MWEQNYSFFRAWEARKNKHRGIDRDMFEIQGEKGQDYQEGTKASKGECANRMAAIGQRP
jgi:hypothetical protein